MESVMTKALADLIDEDVNDTDDTNNASEP